MNSLQHSNQKVAVLIDVQNMYYSAKQLYHTKVNFREILKEAVAGRKLLRAIAYVIKTDIKEEKVFHDALENIGIEVKSKDIQIFYGGAKKGDWDIGIAMDAVRLGSKADTVVLVSGDGDFKELLVYLKTHGCRGEVIAFSKTASSMLKEEADLFTDLGSNPVRYLLGFQKRNFTPHEHQHHNTHVSHAPLPVVIEQKAPSAPPVLARESDIDLINEFLDKETEEIKEKVTEIIEETPMEQPQEPKLKAKLRKFGSRFKKKLKKD